MWILLTVVIVLIIISLYCGIVVRRYNIQADVKLRIAVISDLHSVRHKSLIEKIQQINPDIITMPGDIVDDLRPTKPVMEFFEELSKLNIKTYYVTGNHEIAIKNLPDIKEQIKNDEYLAGIIGRIAAKISG